MWIKVLITLTILLYIFVHRVPQLLVCLARGHNYHRHQTRQSGNILIDWEYRCKRCGRRPPFS